jgi:hypothetical protein
MTDRSGEGGQRFGLRDQGSLATFAHPTGQARTAKDALPRDRCRSGNESRTAAVLQM